MGSLPYEIAVARGVAALWGGAGLVAVSWDDPFPEGARWPVLMGPSLPLDVHECVVLTPRPHTVDRANIAVQMGVRVRSRPAAPADVAQRRMELWSQSQALVTALTPHGRPGGPHRFDGINVSRVTARPTMTYDPDGSDRLSISLEVGVYGRPIRAT